MNWAGMFALPSTSRRAPESDTSDSRQLTRCSSSRAIQAEYRKGFRGDLRLSDFIALARLAVHGRAAVIPHERNFNATFVTNS